MAIDFKSIEATIGYDFENKDLLQQAFVRRSYSEEKGGQNNEVLEFIGDKALDFAVVRNMMKSYGKITEEKGYRKSKLRNPKYFQTKLNEGNFTDVKKGLVEKKTLAKCMDKLGFHKQLIMGEGDIKQNVQEQDSVKEDLFEAIIGAVTLDCDWDMDVVTDVIERMIDFDAYFSNENVDSRNYVGKIQQWSQQNGYGLPEYHYAYLENNAGYQCTIVISKTDIECQGAGTSEAKARMSAAKEAYFYLLDSGYVINEYEEAVGKADYDRCLSQINELIQKKMIEKPTYEFSQNYDENGNPIWVCTMKIKGIDESFSNSASIKKEAQKKCVYKMLMFLMDEKE